MRHGQQISFERSKIGFTYATTGEHKQMQLI